MTVAETPLEKVARIKAELEAKRNAPAAAPPAPPIAAPVPEPPPAAAPPPSAQPPASDCPTHIAGMTPEVWNVLAEDTRRSILAASPPPAPAAPVAPPQPPQPAPAAPAAPAAAPANQIPAAGQPLFSQQTAPINPPDMLGGAAPPAPAAPTAEPATRTRGRKPAAAAAPAAAGTDATTEVLAKLDLIVAWLEAIAAK